MQVRPRQGGGEVGAAGGGIAPLRRVPGRDAGPPGPAGGQRLGEPVRGARGALPVEALARERQGAVRDRDGPVREIRHQRGGGGQRVPEIRRGAVGEAGAVDHRLPEQARAQGGEHSLPGRGVRQVAGEGHGVGGPADRHPVGRERPRRERHPPGRHAGGPAVAHQRLGVGERLPVDGVAGHRHRPVLEHDLPGLDQLGEPEREGDEALRVDRRVEPPGGQEPVLHGAARGGLGGGAQGGLAVGRRGGEAVEDDAPGRFLHREPVRGHPGRQDLDPPDAEPLWRVRQGRPQGLVGRHVEGLARQAEHRVAERRPPALGEAGEPGRQERGRAGEIRRRAPGGPGGVVETGAGIEGTADPRLQRPPADLHRAAPLQGDPVLTRADRRPLERRGGLHDAEFGDDAARAVEGREAGQHGGAFGDVRGLAGGHEVAPAGLQAQPRLAGGGGRAGGDRRALRLEPVGDPRGGVEGRARPDQREGRQAGEPAGTAQALGEGFGQRHGRRFGRRSGGSGPRAHRLSGSMKAGSLLSPAGQGRAASPRRRNPPDALRFPSRTPSRLLPPSLRLRSVPCGPSSPPPCCCRSPSRPGRRASRPPRRCRVGPRWSRSPPSPILASSAWAAVPPPAPSRPSRRRPAAS